MALNVRGTVGYFLFLSTVASGVARSQMTARHCTHFSFVVVVVVVVVFWSAWGVGADRGRRS